MKYLFISFLTVAMLLVGVTVRAQADPSSSSGMDPAEIRRIASEIASGLLSPLQSVLPTTAANTTLLNAGAPGEENTQVINGDVRVEGRLHAVRELCVGADTGNCFSSFRGQWCGMFLGFSGMMDCQGVSLPNCPPGYTYMTVGIASGLSFFGTCFHR